MMPKVIVEIEEKEYKKAQKFLELGIKERNYEKAFNGKWRVAIPFKGEDVRIRRMVNLLEFIGFDVDLKSGKISKNGSNKKRRSTKEGT